jgi:CheY-like chemotaxis protein
MQRDPFGYPRSGAAVLVADDEPVLRLLLLHVLEQAGLRVLMARDGLEALERLGAAADEVSLVLLDVNMPGRSGADLVAAVRGLRPDVPVVLMSGQAWDEAAERFAGHAIAGFLEKPFRSDELLTLVRAALEAAEVPCP